MMPFNSCFRNSISTVIAGVIVICASSICGCSKKEDGASVPVVARVGDWVITPSEFKSYLAGGMDAAQYPVSKDKAENRLDELVLEELLYQEALRLQLDRSPGIRQRIRQMLVHELIDKNVNEKIWSRSVDDFEIQQYYEQHLAEFQRPAQVRAADIYIAVPAGATEARRDELRQKAQTILNQALTAKKNRLGIGSLIHRYSDRHDRYENGDTGFFDINGDPVGVDEAMAAAAFELDRVGSMSEQLIETSEGFHIIMLTGKRSAVKIPLDSVQDQLERRIRRESVARVRRAYLESLRKNARIEIDDERIDMVLAELNKHVYAKRSATTDNASQSRRLHDEAPPDFPGRGN